MFLGHFKHYPGQSEYIFDCPECGKRKFSINFSKLKAHCWTCAENYSFGSLHKFLKFHYSDHLQEFKEILGEFDLGDDDVVVEEKKEREPLEYPYSFSDVDIGICSVPYYNYLIDRGLKRYIIEKYKIGYCSSGRFQSRVIIPSYDKIGNLNFYTGRHVFDGSPSYLNVDTEKTEIIFGENHIDWTRPLIISEGVFDMFSIEQTMQHYASYTVMLGKTLEGTYLLDQILLHKPHVFLAADNDAIKDVEKIAANMLSWGIDVFIAKPPKKVKDFGQLMMYKNHREIVKEAFKMSQRYNYSI